MYLLGIDLGTTGCKSMVFTYNGDILSSEYIEYDLIIGDKGYIEQDADLWWQIVRTTVRNVVDSSGIDGKQIKALSISSQGISFVPIDKNGNTLMNAICWLDGRAIDEAEVMADTFGTEAIYSSMGKHIYPSYVLPKLMWIKKHRPEIYEHTWKFMMAMDFLIYRISGVVITDYSMASGTLAYDLTNKTWSDDIFSKMDIDMEKLPALGCLGYVAGTVQKDVAQELGLSTDCLVVVGAQDQRCASYGAGIDKGIITVSLGTAAAVCSICSGPIIDQNKKVTCCGLDENHWMLESVIGTSGIALKWVKNTFFNNFSYSEMDEMAKLAPAGSNGVMFYPYLENKGSGTNGAFTGLGLHITDKDIVRAVFEGISYQIKMHIQAHEEANGHMQQIRIFGGGAKSDIWAQILADITGKPVLIPRTNETANLGAAIIAGIGAKVFKDYDDALKIVGATSKTFEPDPEMHQQYEVYYGKYRKLDEKAFT